MDDVRVGWINQPYALVRYYETTVPQLVRPHLLIEPAARTVTCAAVLPTPKSLRRVQNGTLIPVLIPHLTDLGANRLMKQALALIRRICDNWNDGSAQRAEHTAPDVRFPGLSPAGHRIWRELFDMAHEFGDADDRVQIVSPDEVHPPIPEYWGVSASSSDEELIQIRNETLASLSESAPSGVAATLPSMDQHLVWLRELARAGLHYPPHPDWGSYPEDGPPWEN